MKSFRGTGMLALLLIFLVILSLPLGACFVARHPTLAIQVHNQTDKPLKIFLDGEIFVGDADPGKELKFNTLGSLPGYRVTAKEAGGNTVFSTTFTREDVKRKGTKDVEGNRTYQVVIPPKPE